MHDLHELITSGHTALITQECQNGAIGEGALWPALAEAARPAVANIARLVRAARSARVPVLHCVVAKRPDLRGSNHNAPLYRAATKPGRLAMGTRSTQIIEEIAGDQRDFVLVRTHGVSPMYRTGLDPILRNLGVRTIVVCGVSVNVAIISLCMDAVNASYRVVVARDAVAGAPPDYALRVVDNTLSSLAIVAPSGDIVSVWEES